MRVVYGKVVEDGKVVRKAVILEDRICSQCGNTFAPKRQKSVFCSRECGKVHEREQSAEKNKERARKWYAENKNKAAARRKKQYWSNPEYYRTKTREWTVANRERARLNKSKRDDSARHGNQRIRILEENKGICSECGKNTLVGWRDSCAHHETFDKNNHLYQRLLCRSCHAKVHGLHKPKIVG